MSRRNHAPAVAPEDQGWTQTKTVVVNTHVKRYTKKFMKMVEREGWEIVHERTRGSWEFKPGQSEFTLRRRAR